MKSICNGLRFKIISFCSRTLYVGQHQYGLYALPSYVDSGTTIISSNIEHLLLEGPTMSHLQAGEMQVPLPGDHFFISNTDIIDDAYESIKRTKNIIMLGKTHRIAARVYTSHR